MAKSNDAPGPGTLAIVGGVTLLTVLGARWAFKSTTLGFYTRAGISLAGVVVGVPVALLAPKYFAAVGAGVAIGSLAAAGTNAADGYALANLTGAQLPSTTATTTSTAAA